MQKRWKSQKPAVLYALLLSWEEWTEQLTTVPVKVPEETFKVGENIIFLNFGSFPCE
jgi:hypothetical protein